MHGVLSSLMLLSTVPWIIAGSQPLLLQATRDVPLGGVLAAPSGLLALGTCVVVVVLAIRIRNRHESAVRAGLVLYTIFLFMTLILLIEYRSEMFGLEGTAAAVATGAVTLANAATLVGLCFAVTPTAGRGD